MGEARLLRTRLSGRDRAGGAGGRGGALGAGADLGPAHRGVQRHLRRLHRPRHQDGDPVTRLGQDHLSLVGTQDPAKIRDNFREFVQARLPKGITAEFSKLGGGSPAIEVAEDSPYLARAADALAAEFGRPTVLMGAGGSIPVVRSFKDLLGMDSLLVGFSLNDDAIHSPNEKYNLSSFHHGIRSWARILDSLAG
jgi:hypothetical protein